MTTMRSRLEIRNPLWRIWRQNTMWPLSVEFCLMRNCAPVNKSGKRCASKRSVCAMSCRSCAWRATLLWRSCAWQMEQSKVFVQESRTRWQSRTYAHAVQGARLADSHHLHQQHRLHHQNQTRRQARQHRLLRRCPTRQRIQSPTRRHQCRRSDARFSPMLQQRRELPSTAHALI